MIEIKKKNKITSGVKEWASSSVNVISGCSNNCKYCYAKKMAIRFGRKTEETWKIMEINEKAVNKKYGKRQGRIMFPTSHDITPLVMEPCLKVLNKMLNSRNEVLITTKPNLLVIRTICDDYLHSPFKDQIQFRFTIGSLDNDTLKFWEPGAPSFTERFQSLQYAFNKGYKTSISIEPMLERAHLFSLVRILDPYITESIWIGTMNYISTKIPNEEWKYYKEARATRDPRFLRQIKGLFSHNSKIRWKDSIRNILEKDAKKKEKISEKRLSTLMKTG